MTAELALATIRSMGVKVELRGDGLAVSPPKPDAVELARTHKAGIVSRLRVEAFDGPCWATSPYRVSSENIYDIAYRLSLRYETKELARKVMRLILDREDALNGGYDAWTAKIAETAPELMRLADQIAEATGYLLRGDALAQAVRAEVSKIGRDLGAFA